MRARTVGAGCAGLLLSLALAGCQGAPVDAARATPTRVSPSGYGAVFLAAGECGARGPASFGEVACRSESAVARVLARHDGGPSGGPVCPAGTDFVLHISESDPAGIASRGFACMRNLEPPHPGDPGGGGGPRTVVGDCVYAAGEGRVRETACDGSGERAPQYRVGSAVRVRDRCPPSTALYVALGGGAPVGCAVRL
ncbi:hypothetical protein ABT127_31345 [Streptomyces sp. NPDC001904]|uniref:hypothetical protein n=1 Tax=Streptomyces sp. NPDC001904 TaxID=3154531 RepID=UPI00331C59DB